MQLEESKYMDHQNDKRAYQSELDGQVLRKIQQQAEDLRQSNDHLSMCKLNRIMFTLTVSGSKVSDIKKWVNAPEYMREFEKAQKTRLPDTGDYVFSHSVYQSWKLGKSLQHEGQSDVITPNMPQILLVTGENCYLILF
jgi:hypothetical protein